MEALYDIESMRRFAGFALGDDAIPDETTILNFRRLLPPDYFHQANGEIGRRPDNGNDAQGNWSAPTLAVQILRT
jgi:hypothetical protein